MQRQRILIVQLASMGDCLFVTTLAKQIKVIDYPDSHLTWLIGSKYSQVLLNNHYIDEIIEIPFFTIQDNTYHRSIINEHIEKLGGYSNYSEIIITDYVPVNYKYWYGTTRSSLFRSYPHKLKINPRPLLFLTTEEKVKVLEFCLKHNLNENSFNILFECSPNSGQSLMTIDKAKQIAENIVKKNKNVKIILSSNQSITTNNPNIIDGSSITWRANAELINYCNLLIGCSSGISWLCTSECSKQKPFMQIVNPLHMGGKISPSMKADFEFFGINTDFLIELNNPKIEDVLLCAQLIIDNKINLANKIYNRLELYHYNDLRFIKDMKVSLSRKIVLSLLFFPIKLKLILQLLINSLFSKLKNTILIKLLF